jgi:hypothetical protein
MLAALGCGSDSEKPCLPADAATGRCQAPPEKRVQLPPGSVLPDWAQRLCQDWHRPDGSCDPMQIFADYQECLTQQGLPEQQRMLDQGVGSRNVMRARDRATYLCLELRRWMMSEEARQRWLDLPPPAPTPPS